LTDQNAENVRSIYRTYQDGCAQIAKAGKQFLGLSGQETQPKLSNCAPITPIFLQAFLRQNTKTLHTLKILSSGKAAKVADQFQNEKQKPRPKFVNLPL
jgi:hypothetical protein